MVGYRQRGHARSRTTEFKARRRYSGWVSKYGHYVEPVRKTLNFAWKNRGKIASAGAAIAGSRFFSRGSIHQRAQSEGVGGSMSKFYYGKRKMSPFLMKLYRKGAAKNYKLYNNPSRFTAPVGQQNVVSLMSMFNQSEVAAMSAAISGNATNKFALLGCSASIEMTNQDAGVAVIDIYDIVARRDLSLSNVQNPVNAWQSSYSDEGGSNTDYQIVGATPFSSDLFTQFFKVLKVTHLIMSPGQVHRHKVNFSPNKQIDLEYVSNVGYGFKGLTCFTMAVIRGAPYNDSTTKTQVSTGTVAIDSINLKQYKYTWVQDIDTTWSKTNNLPSSFTVGEDIMNFNTSAVIPDAQA